MVEIFDVDGVQTVAVESFGARGDLFQDDTKSINDALAFGATNKTAVALKAEKSYLVNNLNIQANQSIQGNGARLMANADNVKIIPIDKMMNLQSGDGIKIENVSLYANGKKNCKGVDISTGHANVFLNQVYAEGFTEGINLGGAQFGKFYNLKAYKNDVGIITRTDPKGGGANSNTFYHLQAVGNKVGVLVYAANTKYPNHSNLFLNPSILENTVCALAILGNGLTELTVMTSANEYNGKGPDKQFVYEGQVIKQCSIYVKSARLKLMDYVIQEATVSPAILAEAGSEVLCDSFSGYGNPSGKPIECDSTSSVYLTGFYSSLGEINQCAAYPSHLLRPPAPSRFSGVPVRQVNTAIRNYFPGNVYAPGFEPSQATVSTVKDDEIGQSVSQITFAKQKGTSESNRAVLFDIFNKKLLKGDDKFFSILVKADRNCNVRIGLYGQNADLANIDLKANRWTRFAVFHPDQVDGETFIMHANDASGAVVRVSCLQTYRDRPTASSLAIISDLLSTGSFNPNK